MLGVAYDQKRQVAAAWRQAVLGLEKEEVELRKHMLQLVDQEPSHLTRELCDSHVRKWQEAASARRVALGLEEELRGQVLEQEEPTSADKEGVVVRRQVSLSSSSPSSSSPSSSTPSSSLPSSSSLSPPLPSAHLLHLQPASGSQLVMHPAPGEEMWEKQRIMGKSGAKEELVMDLEEEAAQKAEMHLGTIKAETHRDISPSSSQPSCPPPRSWRRITPPPSTPTPCC